MGNFSTNGFKPGQVEKLPNQVVSQSSTSTTLTESLPGNTHSANMLTSDHPSKPPAQSNINIASTKTKLVEKKPSISDKVLNQSVRSSNKPEAKMCDLENTVRDLCEQLSILSNSNTKPLTNTAPPPHGGFKKIPCETKEKPAETKGYTHTEALTNTAPPTHGGLKKIPCETKEKPAETKGYTHTEALTNTAPPTHGGLKKIPCETKEKPAETKGYTHTEALTKTAPPFHGGFKKDLCKATNGRPVETKWYRRVPLDPQVEEILLAAPKNIEPNLVQGPYKSPEHYLNVQIRLLREDCMASLRDGIQQIRQDYASHGKLRHNEHLTFYPHCRFVCVNVRKKILGYELCFDPDQLLSSRRKSLMTGALLAFSSDNFQTFFFGAVARTDERDMLDRRVIVVELYNGKQLRYVDFDTAFAMVEPSSFFAPYYFVIKTLQSFSNNNFPFEQYVINARQQISCPSYFIKDRTIFNAYDLSEAVGQKLGLNPSQFEAYKTALTKELAIIQGPPGTGKTYVGLRIMEALLQNERLTQYRNGPILLVCYTNHALDQFVEGLLRYTQNVCRLGYSEKNKKVKPYNHIEMIETFVAMKRVVRSFCKDKKDKTLETRDFDLYFQPDWSGKFALMVKCFRTGTYKRRTYDASLMKAYYAMFIKSPFNGPYNPSTGFVKNMCFKIEKTSERIQQNISLIDTYNGILGVKHLEKFMNKISRRALSAVGELDAWLTEDMSRTINTLDEDMSGYAKRLAYSKNFVQHNTPDSDSDSYLSGNDTDFELALDRVKSVFYSTDLTHVHNDIENTDAELSDLKKGLPLRMSHLTPLDSVKRKKLLGAKLQCLRRMLELLESRLETMKEDTPSMDHIGSILDTVVSREQLLTLKLPDRWHLYSYWVQCFRRTVFDQINEQSVEYKDAVEDYMFMVREPDLVKVMRTKDVVAMTTTKAAKIHEVLCKLQPKIVIIEEAAEVLEAHIIASLSRHCEHLVLIGDHKQLRPSTNVHRLASEYNLNVSLFERLVKNRLHHVSLEVQHRMRPEICDLLTPSIYARLYNHRSVTELPQVKGMDGNIQFLNHRVHEGNDFTEHSMWNAYEVDMLLNLAHYLLRQGYRCRDMTIIAAYAGQKELFESTIEKEFPVLSSVLVTTIDGYQGEENKIILLSLVRSNVRNKIGFLSTPNRVCVALSRAKLGLFMSGNMNCLAAGSELWRSVRSKLTARGAIGDGFSLLCTKHGMKMSVRSAEQFAHVCCK